MPTNNTLNVILRDEKSSSHFIEFQMKGKFVSSTPFFFLNVINAYEIPGSVIVDVIGYDSPDILDQVLTRGSRSFGVLLSINRVTKPPLFTSHLYKGNFYVILEGLCSKKYLFYFIYYILSFNRPIG